MQDKAQRRHCQEHGKGQHRRHGDMRGRGKGEGDQPQQVREQHEHEQREDMRKEAHCVTPGDILDHLVDEAIGQFRG